jgi:hypothetical protein
MSKATLREAARRYPAQAFYLLVPHLSLQSSGYRSTYHEETLRLVHRWGYPAVTEMVPYRVLNNGSFEFRMGDAVPAETLGAQEMVVNRSPSIRRWRLWPGGGGGGGREVS